MESAVDVYDELVLVEPSGGLVFENIVIDAKWADATVCGARKGTRQWSVHWPRPQPMKSAHIDVTGSDCHIMWQLSLDAYNRLHRVW